MDKHPPTNSVKATSQRDRNNNTQYNRFTGRRVIKNMQEKITVTVLIMAALCNRGPLYFCPVISIVFFFSSPNLSSRRLDVYHTLTHGVALVRIQNAGLKCAACGSLQIRDAKKSPKIAIWAPWHNLDGLYLRN